MDPPVSRHMTCYQRECKCMHSQLDDLVSSRGDSLTIIHPKTRAWSPILLSKRAYSARYEALAVERFRIAVDR